MLNLVLKSCVLPYSFFICMLQASVLTIYTIHSASKSTSTSIYMHNTNPNSITIFFNLFIIINVLFCWFVFLKRFIFIVCFTDAINCCCILCPFWSFYRIHIIFINMCRAPYSLKFVQTCLYLEERRWGL